MRRVTCEFVAIERDILGVDSFRSATLKKKSEYCDLPVLVALLCRR
jgi:hypothetical protein